MFGNPPMEPPSTTTDEREVLNGVVATLTTPPCRGTNDQDRPTRSHGPVADANGKTGTKKLISKAFD